MLLVDAGSGVDCSVTINPHSPGVFAVELMCKVKKFDSPLICPLSFTVKVEALLYDALYLVYKQTHE